MTKSWNDDEVRADSEIAAAAAPSSPQPYVARPRGRPPRNTIWDSIQGKYVPTNAVWVLAANTSDFVVDHEVPLTIEQAKASPDAPHWIRAISEELQSLRDCAVWKSVVLASVSKHCRPIPTKWVFKIKGDGKGNVVRYKARLVVCGYRQKLGRDYDLTYSPVAHAASIRMLLALAVTLRLHLRQFDIKTAFLYGHLPAHQPVYLQPPQGVPVAPGHVLQLQRAMYGLKQAPLMFNKHLDASLGKLRFRRSHYDPCVYFRRDGDGSLLILAVVVDDILLAASSKAKADGFARALRGIYKITDIGFPARIVGLNISASPQSLHVDQNQFVKDLARRFGQLNSNPVHTPTTLGEVAQGASPPLKPGHDYLSLVGSLLWVTISRPDIAVAVSKACARSMCPTKADRSAAIRILRYLLTTPEVKLTMSRKNNPRHTAVTTYVDAA